MHLRANAVDELPARVRALHERDHALHLRIVRVEVEVVDVESMRRPSACARSYLCGWTAYLLCGGVGGTRGLEGDGDERLAEDVEEDLRCEGTVFVEDLAWGYLLSICL